MKERFVGPELKVLYFSVNDDLMSEASGTGNGVELPDIDLD